MEDVMKVKVLATALVIGLGGCTVEQTREGEAPEIEGGQLPQYEVEPADVDVEWDTTQVRVPRMDVQPRTDTARDTMR